MAVTVESAWPSDFEPHCDDDHALWSRLSLWSRRLGLVLEHGCLLFKPEPHCDDDHAWCLQLGFHGGGVIYALESHLPPSWCALLRLLVSAVIVVMLAPSRPLSQDLLNQSRLAIQLGRQSHLAMLRLCSHWCRACQCRDDAASIPFRHTPHSEGLSLCGLSACRW